MHDPRINTVAAIVVVLLFGLGAVGLIERAIARVDWSGAVLTEAGVSLY